MITIKRTDKLLEEMQSNIDFQRQNGYDSAVKINQHWVETGEGVPIWGIPGYFADIDIQTPYWVSRKGEAAEYEQ